MSLRAILIVGKLTARGTRRHEFDARRVCLGGGILLFLLAASVSAATESVQWQATENIAATAEQFLRDRIGSAARRTTVQAGTLDSRHRLARCGKPLEAFLRRGTKIASRTIVGVRCTGEKPWKVYVPVAVVVTDTVLVARRTLPRGHLLVADDLATEKRDVSRLISGYISNVEELLGQRLKTQLIAGRVLTPAMLQADIAVKRGQAVTLTIKSRGIDIQMSGKALMDGAINQRIRVENTNSGRVVEGIVRSREHVEILVAKSSQFIHAKPKVSPRVADMRSSNNDR
ncbi:MAG: flagellar basal body P-ring formation chaperone FlgA [Woeseiaceae bacterium]